MQNQQKIKKLPLRKTTIANTKSCTKAAKMNNSYPEKTHKHKHK